MGARRPALSRRMRGVRHPGIRAVRRRIVPVRPRRWRWRTWLMAGLAAGGVAVTVLLAYRLWPAPALAATVPLKHGTVEEAVLTDALLFRREQVLKAPASGAVARLVAEGQRVRVGAPVVLITPGGAPAAEPGAAADPAGPAGSERSAVTEALHQLNTRIYQLAVSLNQARDRGDTAEEHRLQAELDATALRQADLTRQAGSGAQGPGPAQAPTPPPSASGGKETAVAAATAGVLVYQVDGLEEALSPDGAAAWKPSWFRTLAVPLQQRTGEGQVTAGAPLFKVVDNLSLGLVLVVPAGRVADVPAGSWVQLRFTGRDGLIPARIARKVQEGSDVLLHLTAPALPEDLAGRRKVQVALVLAEHTGKVVPRSAIDVRDGRQGVWIWEGKEPEFRPCRVVGGNQQEVVLETDLSDGTRIVRVAPRSMR